MARRRHGGSSREYPRTARVNELVREIVAEELERVDDPRLEWVSVTGVEVSPELSSGVVYFSSLAGPEGDAEVLGALAESRVRLQGAIGRQARLRRTPELSFRADSGVRDGFRVEEILRDLGPLPDPEAGSDAETGTDLEAGSDPETDADPEPGGDADAEGASESTGVEPEDR
jgi:ribosome-binding factor A